MARHGRSAGFFAVDRDEMWRALAELTNGPASNGYPFWFFVGLTIAADEDGCVHAENIRETAHRFRLTSKMFRSAIAQLEAGGYVKWERPVNQHVGGGVIWIVRDIESVRTRRPPQESS